MKLKGFLLFFVSSFLFADQARQGKLPLPRFASFRSNNANTHIGPGKQYPIQWNYRKHHMPVEIIAEFDTWRKIKDVDGTISWAHVSLLSGKRYAVILGQKTQNLKAKPYENATVIAKIDPTCIVQIKKLKGVWIYVESRSELGCFQGWIKNSQLWGIYPHETKF